ncbi:Cloroperoxidase [Mycena venus]|uniref:Cloroperoxidase n=1 Tax=Mycena venus TaxID=2733690 RepID=A0A8H6YII7_9AGAR|nr:Cloroperoxidase [Mycena venus]
MKSFSLLLLVVSPLFIAVNASPNIRDAPTTTVDIQDGQTGTLMVLPPRQTDTGTKNVPDANHPFIAPGPNDMRGPCPAMNTLANHGYISRNGITSFEEIINGAGEAFNIDRDMAAGMAALNILTRGNPFVNKISIGLVSPLVPPLPGQIDGPETQGIAKHGRVEGDGSMTRSDVHIGDNRNFNQTLWDEGLEVLAKFGDDGPDGPATVFNLQAGIELVNQTLVSDQVLDPEVDRFSFWSKYFLNTDSNGIDTDSVASVFANGTTKLATKRIITTFFMNQTFPENWFRPQAPVLGSNSPIAGEVAAALSDWVPGHNDENGVFVADPRPPAPFNSTSGCANYWDVLSNAVPAALANVTGIFKQNVDLLTGILFNASGCAEPIAPAGPTNV